MVFQTNRNGSPSYNHSSCLFNGISSYREIVQKRPWDENEHIAAWHGSIYRGFVTGDLNRDGDMDDPGEAVIRDYPGLLSFLNLPLEFLGKFPLSDFAKYDNPAYWVIVPWKWKYTHWALGITKPVRWDSIEGGSQSVLSGAPLDLDKDGNGGLRVFKVKPA